ncbi:hypothetical protein [Brevundimonas diminuta]|uniref:hypothetical protein n=1 Tax=Brevundimonas diminuta TaxID=293 RepID=UPI0012FBA565|nr:hypothetical protein [Brevundimonas diminuta]
MIAINPLTAPQAPIGPRLSEKAQTFDGQRAMSLDAVVERAKTGLAGTALADRVTPETLAALLRLDPDGDLVLDEQGRPLLREPGAVGADDEILFGAVRHALDDATEPHPQAGDDARFVEAVTGYRRVELGGGLHTWIGADGAGAPADSIAWQLGPLIDAQRREGHLDGAVSRSWFDDWLSSCRHLEEPTTADLLRRAEAFFDALPAVPSEPRPSSKQR